MHGVRGHCQANIHLQSKAQSQGKITYCCIRHSRKEATYTYLTTYVIKFDLICIQYLNITIEPEARCCSRG
jgi:hypothetical protein